MSGLKGDLLISEATSILYQSREGKERFGGYALSYPKRKTRYRRLRAKPTHVRVSDVHAM